MTTTPLPPHSARLRAVSPPPAPPTSTTPSTSSPPTSSPSPPPPSQPSEPRPRWHWLVLTGTLVGLSGLSCIPVGHRVTGPGEVSATQDAFETISMPSPGGTLVDIAVSTNQQVAPGTLVALLRSDSLEAQHNQAQQQLAQSRTLLESRRQQIHQRQADQQEAIARESTAQQEIARLQQELQSGTLPEVIGWQSEISALDAEILGLQSTLQKRTTRIEQATPAVVSGAISQEEMDLWQAEQIQLQNQITQRQGQIAAKQAQIEALYQSKRTALSQAQANLHERQAARQSVEQSIQSAAQEYATQEQVLVTQESELVRVEGMIHAYELVHTSITGTVITPQHQLDALRGRYIDPGQPLLEVINPENLTIDMWVRQEDRDLITPGMTAEFRPQSARWESYTATVETVASQAEFNEAEQKPMVRVTLRLMNGADHPLPLNMTGTARIVTESMPIYRKATREFLKVVPLQKLLAF